MASTRSGCIPRSASRRHARNARKFGPSCASAGTRCKCANSTRRQRRPASGQTFERFALEWLSHSQGRKNWSAGHYEKSKQAIERDVLPLIGKLPVAEITSAMIATVIEKIAKQKIAKRGCN